MIDDERGRGSSAAVRTARLVTHSASGTAAVGWYLGRECRGGEVILLEGDLGAGKTTLAQGLAAGLDVRVPVVSPTFVVLREYRGRLPLYHFDFYRLEGAGRDAGLEFGDYLEAHGVSVIEWPSHAPEVVPDSFLHLTLDTLSPPVTTATAPRGGESEGAGGREIVLRAAGLRYEALTLRVVAALTAGQHPDARVSTEQS